MGAAYSKKRSYYGVINIPQLLLCLIFLQKSYKVQCCEALVITALKYSSKHTFIECYAQKFDHVADINTDDLTG